MLALASHSCKRRALRFTHNLQSAETVAPMLVGVACILAILQKRVCDGSHTALVNDPQVQLNLTTSHPRFFVGTRTESGLRSSGCPL
jgi:hypothetical protein